MVMENTDDEFLDRLCYVCSVDLTQKYKDDTTKQNDLKSSTQKFPEMIRWDGQKKEVCGPCYKSIEEGIEVYQQRHLEFVRPKPKEW